MPDFGDRAAVLMLRDEEQSSFSYKELSERVERLTAGLTAECEIVGRRAAIVAPNHPNWIVACLATVNAGGVAVPVDGKLDEKSLKHVLEDSEASIIFASGEERQRIERLATHPFRMIDIGDDLGDGSEWLALMKHRPAESRDPDPDDPAVIFYTSGTTGPPKGVPLSHRNLLFEIEYLRNIGLMSPGERLLLPLPLHHVYPFVVGMLTPLAYGVSIVLPQSMTGPHVQQAIKSGRVASVLGVPRLYEALLTSIEERITSANWVARHLYPALRRASLFARDRLSLGLGRTLFAPLHRRIGPELRLLASGGAALDRETALKLESLGWTVATGYGLTETAPLLTLVPPGDGHFETAGKPIEGVEIRIAPPEDGNDGGAPKKDGFGTNGADGIGEIQAKGPNVFAGYLNLSDRTDAAFTADGWFRTEDRGWIDDSGYLRIVGRASTVVVTTAGKNISIEELEHAYERHPLIKEIGIFMREKSLSAVAVPDPSELRRAGETSPEQPMHEAVRQRSRQLPSHERIDDFVISHDALVRTRLGKIRRNVLRDRFKDLRAGKQQETAETGPMAIAAMSGEDQVLLEEASAREVWAQLSEMYPTVQLTPDSDVTLDLGIDSLEWVNVTLAIRERTGIELSEQATERIETVRDLLNEVLDQADRTHDDAADLEEEPEKFLTADQKRWLQPLGTVASAAARVLYSLNRALVRTLFRLRVSGLENLRSGDQVILTPNHASVLDPLVIAAALPYDFLRGSAFAGWTGMAFANPLNRAVARLARTLPIEHGRAAFSSLALALVTVRQGKSLIWFPEGQRSHDGKLQRFQQGLGVLLEKHPLPVVPVIIDGTFDAMPPGRRIPIPRRIEIRLGKACRLDQFEGESRDEPTEARMVDGLRQRMAELQVGAGD